MGQHTSIPWCHSTFNCWRGCTKVSPGCEHCYAWHDSFRFPAIRGVWGAKGTRVCPAEAAWREPLRWDKAAKKAGERRRVFCASLADVFEDWRGQVQDHNEQRGWSYDGAWPWAFDNHAKASDDGRFRALRLDDLRARLFFLIAETPNLDWLLVTKRPENVTRFVPAQWLVTWPANVWLGATVENRKHGVPRIDVARSIQAGIRFLSVEPLIEDLGYIDLTGIHWVIVGGESGPSARAFDVRWARSIRDQCRVAGVPFFMKQMGGDILDTGGGEGTFADEWPAKTDHTFFSGDNSYRVWLTSKKGEDWDEWPADLRVREFPTLEAATR